MKNSQELPMLQKTDVPSSGQNCDWFADHATEIAQYNDWADKREPYARRVRRWRESQTNDKSLANAAV